MEKVEVKCILNGDPTIFSGTKEEFDSLTRLGIITNDTNTDKVINETSNNVTEIINSISDNEAYRTTKGFVKDLLPRKIVNQISLTKGVYKNMALVLADFEKNCEPQKLGSTEFADYDISLYKANLNMLMYGHLPSACIQLVDDEVIILVNSAWIKAPEHVKKAILAHELGHLASGHLGDPMEMIILNVLRMFGSQKTTTMELEADAFAVNAGHKEGMLEFFSIIDGLGLKSKELTTRQHAVEDREEPKGFFQRMIQRLIP